jgi:hypothetical protein
LSLEFDFSFFERGGVEGISHSTGVAFIMYRTIGTLEKSVRHTVVVTLLDFQIVSFLSEACLMKEIDVPKEYGASKSKHVFGNNIWTLLEGDKHVNEEFMDPHILRNVSD